jgi:hypothetical protein
MSRIEKKLIMPAPNTALYPVDGNFNNLQVWEEAAAAQDVLNANAVAAHDYMGQTFASWFANYDTGRLSWDSVPPQPPVKKWAFATETFNDDGSFGFTYEKVDAPTGELVCAVPTFKRLPPPQGGKVSLMALLSNEVAAPGNPTIPTVPVAQTSVDSAGNKWVRIAVLLLALAFTLPSLHAQVGLACAPQPMAATKSIGEQSMGQWACWCANDSPTPYVLTPAKFYGAVIAIRPVTPAVAQQIFTDSINRLPQSKIVKVGQIALALGGIGATIYTGNAQWSLIGGIVSQNAPAAIKIIANEIPSAAPFTGGQLTAPITITPGGDVPPIVVYAMKMKREELKPFTVALK